jgi:hypothetical protein
VTVQMLYKISKMLHNNLLFWWKKWNCIHLYLGLLLLPLCEYIILNVVNKHPLDFNVSCAKNLCVTKRQFSQLCQKATKTDCRRYCTKPKEILKGSIWSHEARGSIVGWGTMLQAGRSWYWLLMRWIFSIYLILPAALRPWGRLSL